MDVRRVWACPQCERRRKTPGGVTSLRCDCTADGVWMKLVDEHPPSHLYHPYIVEEVEVDEAEFAGEPVVIPELPERPPDERSRHRPDRRRNENGASSETEAPILEPPALDVPEPETATAEADETPLKTPADTTAADTAPADTTPANVESEVGSASGNGQSKSDEPAAESSESNESKPAGEGKPSRKSSRKKRGGRRRGRRKGKPGDST